MGLDIYVGSLTRYYSGQWETVVQRYAHENGLEAKIIRPGDSHEPDEDPDEIRTVVLQWRESLSLGLGNNISAPLDWDESPDSPYFTDKPAWDCYGSLVLWAAYSEHPDLIRPDHCVEDWSSDEPYLRSVHPDFKTKYPSLLRDTEFWLPSDFDFTFRAEDPPGNEAGFGSSYALVEELRELNESTWNADQSTISKWRRDGAEHLAPLEQGAKFAFAIFLELAIAATNHGLVMKLDY